MAAKSIDSVFEAKNNKKLFNDRAFLIFHNMEQNIVSTMIHTKMKPQSTKSVAIGAGLIGADLILNSMKNQENNQLKGGEFTSNRTGTNHHRLQ